jgi:hypothetical protein
MNSTSAFALATLTASLAGVIAFGMPARATEQYAMELIALAVILSAPMTTASRTTAMSTARPRSE